MKTGDIVVKVIDGHCVVCRLEDDNYDPENAWVTVSAENSEELEREATHYVLSGLYLCPADLAARAAWNE